MLPSQVYRLRLYLSIPCRLASVRGVWQFNWRDCLTDSTGTVETDDLPKCNKKRLCLRDTTSWRGIHGVH